jgi:5-methylcytosine-specific restriction endonuclease McrA
VKPFDQYPNDGASLLPRMRGANARHEYGLELQRLTRQTACAYCEVDLAGDYYRWLMLGVDHVIPTAEGKRLRLPEEWIHSYSNLVLCCSACNAFANRFTIADEVRRVSWGVPQFFGLRDRVFVARKKAILARHEEERAFFSRKPWVR